MADDGLKRIKAFDCACGRSLSPEEILDSVSAYAPLDRLFAACPGCKSGIEFDIQSGAMLIGYSYYAGAMHFNPRLRLSAGGLKQSLDDNEALTISFRGRQWTFQPPTDTPARFAVFEGSTFDGKALGELHLEDAGVRLQSLERNHQKVPATTATFILKGGDILNLRGTHKALNVIFARMFRPS
jgi:hypothetical protein